MKISTHMSVSPVSSYPMAYRRMDYDSIDELISCDVSVGNVWKAYIANGGETGQPDGTNSEFYLCRTPAKSAADIRAGWPSVRGAVESARETIRRQSYAACVSLKPETQWDVSGDDVDVGRYLSGEAENMGTDVLTPTPAMGRVVRLWIAVSFSNHVDPQALAPIAANIAGAIDSLEAGGLRCEVTVGFSGVVCNTRKNTYTSAAQVNVTVKRASEPMDIGAITASMHPDLFRRWALWRFRTGIVGFAPERGQVWRASPAPEGMILIRSEEMKCADRCAQTIMLALERGEGADLIHAAVSPRGEAPFHPL